MRNRTVEQIVAVFVPQIQDEIVEVILFIPRERVSDRNADHAVDVSTQTQERCVEVVKDISKDHLQQHTGEQIVGVPVPQIMEEIVGVVKFVHQERAWQRTVEQVVDVPARQVKEEIIEVMKVVCPERVLRGLRNRWMFPYLKPWSRSLQCQFHRFGRTLGG